MNYNKTVTEYINKAQSEQIEILEILRKLIHSSVTDVSEEIKWGFPVFKKTKDFAYFRFTKKHITLGFYNIDKIEDPDNILEGTGKNMRHIKIHSIEEIKSKEIKKLITLAVDERRNQLNK